jgi:hypothetical protein
VATVTDSAIVTGPATTAQPTELPVDLLPPPLSFVTPAATAVPGAATDSAWVLAELARLQRTHAGERATFAQQMQVYRDTLSVLIDEKAELQRNRLKTGEQLAALQHRLGDTENALLVWAGLFFILFFYICFVEDHLRKHNA